jgi:hypothetical protein
VLGCRGPDARGQGAIPRLSGQLFPYTVRQLSGWSKDRGQAAVKDDTTAVMTSISHNLARRRSMRSRPIFVTSRSRRLVVKARITKTD